MLSSIIALMLILLREIGIAFLEIINCIFSIICVFIEQ